MPYDAQLAAAVQALEVHSPSEFSWFGRYSRETSRELASTLTPEAMRSVMLHFLEQCFYRNFYLPGGAAPEPEYFTISSDADAIVFTAKLSAACSAKGWCPDTSWSRARSEKRRILVQRGDLCVSVRRHEILSGKTSGDGQPVTLKRPREAPDLSPGFYSVFGKDYQRPAKDQLIRLYWNLNMDGALQFLRVAPALLDRAGVSYRLKLANQPANFNRCDTAVIYLALGELSTAIKPIGRIYPQVAPFLRSGNLPLTRSLAPGLSWAQEPEGGPDLILRSFGGHRSFLLAEAMLRSYEQGKTSLAARMRSVKHHFRKNDISLSAPYHHSRLPLELFDNLAQEISRPAHPASHRQQTCQPSLLDTARKIAEHIVSDAVWHGDQCNWLSSAHSFDQALADGGNETLRPLGPDLCNGTAGVALFLTDLHQAAGGSRLRRTARGALNHSIAFARKLPPAQSQVSFAGRVGIALAAALVGSRPGWGEYLDHADALLPPVLSASRAAASSDLLTGDAGAVLAYLHLHRILKKNVLLDRALIHGVRLVERAKWKRGACSWTPVGVKAYRNLTSMAHGTSGIALALLELFSITKDPRFRRAAVGALAYERSVYDPESAGWPDFRVPGKLEDRAAAPLAWPCPTSWAHGTAGGVFPRLRAWKILGDDIFREEILRVLDALREPLRVWRDSHTGNWSFADGLAGNCRALLSAAEVLGLNPTLQRSQCVALLQEAGANYGSLGRDWPCATFGGSSPSLMFGLSGIASLCLRLSSLPTSDPFSPHTGN